MTKPIIVVKVPCKLLFGIVITVTMFDCQYVQYIYKNLLASIHYTYVHNTKYLSFISTTHSKYWVPYV